LLEDLHIGSIWSATTGRILSGAVFNIPRVSLAGMHLAHPVPGVCSKLKVLQIVNISIHCADLWRLFRFTPELSELTIGHRAIAHPVAPESLITLPKLTSLTIVSWQPKAKPPSFLRLFALFSAAFSFPLLRSLTIFDGAYDDLQDYLLSCSTDITYLYIGSGSLGHYRIGPEILPCLRRLAELKLLYFNACTLRKDLFSSWSKNPEIAPKLEALRFCRTARLEDDVGNDLIALVESRNSGFSKARFAARRCAFRVMYEADSLFPEALKERLQALTTAS